MSTVKIAFFDTKPYDKTFFAGENKQFGFDIKYFDLKLSVDTVALCNEFDVVCAFVNDRLQQNVLEHLYNNNIKLIAMRCAGYNNIDLAAAYKKIHVVRVPEYSPFAVAEHAVALMLTLNRKTHKAFYRTRDNNFNINGLMGFDMHGKTVGIIGTGRIGRIMISIMNGFNMNILAYDLHPDKQLETRFQVTYTDLDTLYARSDIISLHCPLTRETRHLVNPASIGKMKPGVMIINTSRGGLVDTKALLAALKSGMIGSAGLDVYEEESEYFFEDFSYSIISDDTLARLLTFSNVLITSHQGFFTGEALHNIAHTTLQNIKDYFADTYLKNEICYKCDSDECMKEKQRKCF